MASPPQRTSPASPGFGLALALLVLIAAGKPILMDSLDPDCFWHLRVARQLMHDGIGPLVDELSFASVREPWTPYSWLAELAMLAVWTVGGWKLAIGVHAILNGTFIVMIALCCREIQLGRLTQDDEDVTGEMNAIFAIAAACVWSLAYMSFRPATMAIVVLGAAAWLILRDRRRGERSRAVWAVIPMAALLTNIHLSVILLPLWLIACATGAAWELRRLRGTHDATDLRRRLKRYGVLTACTMLASLATPMLPGAVRMIGHYQSRDVMVDSEIIAEMQPFYHGNAGQLSLALVVLTVLCLARNFRRLRMGELLWFAGMLVLLFRWGRFGPLFAIIGAPVAAVVWPRLRDRVLYQEPVAAAFALVLAVGAWNVARSFPGPITHFEQWLNRHAAYAPGYPTAAADYVDQNVKPASGRLINEFTWGGYLAWRLGDRYQVLMDGRTQLYSRQFWESTYLGDRGSRKRVIQRSNADAAVLPLKRSEFAKPLRELGWTVAWQDGQSQVLLPPGHAPAAKHEPRTH